jgi:hypothetical protein
VVLEGEPKRTEAREASRLSMVVLESAEVEVEQPCAGEQGVGHTTRRKRAVTAMISNRQQVRASVGIPRGGPRNQGDRQAGRESR